ncbi:PadR family transcriptional regulator [Actinomadura madurae]|uniref:PadR family transcriptional regulator n=1 Tax=Actinomadura madurae TaxID=1993 RepID=UPI0020D25C8A|nr:PadR family transcriptional regulator [Actinomadura madurae]MCP9954150.1 helix-turn-helix transcriptional regulator [Actinomadura madurae]MCP9970898.1 helix-turn-helix transcriptional regulator [Actinomadura madurae]MCP9983374.1 helix-turn-helix transcriptional regulator [Actinomadura madurae]MCQ0005062.1 helix-turn-helix transcriptional regulator [Actinomadura madurae]MCQ0019626.1 helix-turn-helix transcriptional regulator [Actinomadura madurae]
MSPVFGHGRLRLYLLKLLEESPRHGYEVIRLLQDRFLGVYSPSPGTIYPRLARLEAEGLVTHEVIKGKKVYSLTDKGREELERRMDELADLEEEIAASAQEFARGVQEDVRQTVRSLREELTQAARTMRDQGKATSKEAWKETTERQKDEWRRQKEYWREQKQAWKEEWRQNWDDAWKTATGTREDVARLKLERLLRRFVEDVRENARKSGVDDDDLAAAQDVLDEARERLNGIFREEP